MSEHINNREYRQKVLKELIMELHNGKSVEEVKPRFEELIKGISPEEISAMEQALIMEGMPVEEIQRLCDVHAAVFKGSIEEIHRPVKPEDTPGHPIHTFKLENRELEKLINERIKPHIEAYRLSGDKADRERLAEDFEALWEIDKHYSRKENLVFPFLEKYGITAPPKVMWGVDDEIRDEIKEVRRLLSGGDGDRGMIAEKAENAVTRVIDMIFKEESILFPMVLGQLTEDEWIQIEAESDEIGFTLIGTPAKWAPRRVDVKAKTMAETKGEEKPRYSAYGGYGSANAAEESGKDGKAVVPAYEAASGIEFETGVLSFEELAAMLNTLPIDITFVDKDGIVKYFSEPKDRIFARPKTVIGRRVQDCHPPASVHIVEKIVEDLKSGRKDHEDFWIRMGDKYVFIRYFAVRDKEGKYLGVIEVTQDIKPIQEITGEKRLLSD